jgi:hypothetical protein
MTNLNDEQGKINYTGRVDLPKKPTDAAAMPAFLKVLCILTFVGCAFGFASGIYNYVTADAKVLEIEQQIAKVQDTGNQTMIGMLESAQEMVEKSAANKSLVLGINMVGMVLCLIGALLMWRRNKNGFFFYAFGELLPPLAMFFVLGMGSGMMGIMMSIFGIFVPIAFIGMYAVNLKHMD